jgi:hypothetical protein
MLVVAKVFHKTIHAFSIGDKSGARNSLVLRKIILRAKDQEFPQGIPMNKEKQYKQQISTSFQKVLT